MSSQSKHPMEEPLEKKESNKRRKYEQVEPGWGAKLDVTLNKKREPKSTIQDSPKRPLVHGRFVPIVILIICV